MRQTHPGTVEVKDVSEQQKGIANNLRRPIWGASETQVPRFLRKFSL